MGHKTVGNALAEWDDADPLVFTMREQADSGHIIIALDLSDLRQGFSEEFLLHLKDILIEWRNGIRLKTIETYSHSLQGIFRKFIELQLFNERIHVIDESFLLVLSTVAEKLTKNQLKTFKSMFLTAVHSPLWTPGLNVDYFPRFEDKKGLHGQQIDRILAKALTRAACVHILTRCEQAYDLGEMNISLFSFVNLAFAVFCRPDSYRQIQLADLTFDEKSRAYFIYILPKKSGIHKPEKIRYKINDAVGILLQKQRQSVIDRYAHLVAPKDVAKLALFPSIRLNADKSAWLHMYANENFGMYETSDYFINGYPNRIRDVFLSDGLTINANVLRHTVGTQLAEMGASSHTIQAVLKHASNNVCKAYVDIAFHGLIGALSDAMQPAFDKHLPAIKRFRSKNDPIDATQAIHSDNLDSGQVELTGECGKLIQCEYAPITCYGCARFVPCWDADHGTNLATVEREIEDCKRRGKAFTHLLEKARVSKYQIIFVMNAAERYREKRDHE